MGIYTDLADSSSQFSAAAPRSGVDRSGAAQLGSAAFNYDPDLKGSYVAADEVQSIPEQTSAGASDTFTLTIELPTMGIVFTTASIVFDATAATIETAIDTATPAAITDTHISVAEASSAGLSDGILTLTFDGATVADRPALLTILTPTGWAQDGTITRTTPGSVGRKAAQAILDLNVATGSWDSGDPVVTLTRPASTGQTRPRYDLIRALAVITISEDGTQTAHDAIVALYPIV